MGLVDQALQVGLGLVHVHHPHRTLLHDGIGRWPA